MVVDLRIKEAGLEKIEAETLGILAKAEKDSAEVDLMPMRLRIEELKTLRDSLKAKREAITMAQSGSPAQAASQGASTPGPA